MKQLKIFTVAAAAAIANSPMNDSILLAAQLPSAGNLAFHAQARLRIEGDEKTDFATNRDFTTFRARPDVTYAPDHLVSLFFQPQFVKQFGEPAFVSTANPSQQTSGASFDTSLSVHQAYFDYRPIEDVKLLLGRQVLSYGDELILGASDWSAFGRSFDAFRSSYKASQGFFDLFAAKVIDNNTAGAGARDTNFFGAYFNAGLGSFLKASDLYAFYQNDASSSPHLYALGARFKSDINELDYRLEGTYEFGSGVKDMVASGNTPYQVSAEFGYTASDLSMKPRVALEGFTSGRNYNQLYPTVHKWLGFANVLSRRNISGWVLHLSGSFNERAGLTFDYHRFYRTFDDVTAFKFASGNLGAPLGKSASPSRYVGQEFDLVAKYKASEALLLTAGAALFLKGDYLQDSFAQDWKPAFYYASMEFSF